VLASRPGRRMRRGDPEERLLLSGRGRSPYDRRCDGPTERHPACSSVGRTGHRGAFGDDDGAAGGGRDRAAPHGGLWRCCSPRWRSWSPRSASTPCSPMTLRIAVVSWLCAPPSARARADLRCRRARECPLGAGGAALGLAAASLLDALPSGNPVRGDAARRDELRRSRRWLAGDSWERRDSSLGPYG
jgi:hypothetical protein